MPFIEPRGVFFSTLDRAEATFQTEGGAVKAWGFFDDAFLDSDVGETRMDTTQPRFTCDASSLTGVEESTPCTIKGAAYTVIRVQPDGTGMATVLLSNG